MLHIIEKDNFEAMTKAIKSDYILLELYRQLWQLVSSNVCDFRLLSKGQITIVNNPEFDKAVKNINELIEQRKEQIIDSFKITINRKE